MLFIRSLVGLSLGAVTVSGKTLYLAGDSTMAVDSGAIIGWGTQVGKYLSLAPVNLAVAGTSARTYTTLGYFTKLINTVASGDIVVIEFGHNDGGGASASATGDCSGSGTTATCVVNGTTVYTFSKYIEDAVKSLKAKNANVIISSNTPDNPYVVGFGKSNFATYAQQSATDTGVTFVDHYNAVLAEYTALGQTTVNSYYPQDHLHTNAAGADIVAQAFIREVICGGSSNPLNAYVSNTNVVPKTCT